ncbi:MAG: ysgA [Caulobacteraceae bacterium]|nr:ysgA [Caulobacteraceae bacterium]
MITIAVPDGTFNAYVARPASTPAPAVIVIQEIYGVNAVVREFADRLAAAGFLAVAPDLFWRIEPGIDLTDQTDEGNKRAFELFGEFDVDAGVKDVAAAIDQVRGLPECTGKVGAVGYCLGGKVAFLVATSTDSDASVSYYGVGLEGLVGEAEKLANPLLLHIAEEDRFVPPTAQATILAALKNHPQVELFTYPGRDHAFARPGGDNYHDGDAALADQRSLRFLNANLK